MNETVNTATTVDPVGGTQEPSTSTSVEANQTPLVAGESSVYKDVESLLKGKASADKFIEVLKKENQELREQLMQTQNIENFRKELQDMTENLNTSTNEQTSSMTAEEIQKIAVEALQQQQAKQVAEGNLQRSLDALKAKFGTEAENKLTSKANEIGMSVDALKLMAQEHPKAFTSLLGLDAKDTSESSFEDLSRTVQPATMQAAPSGLDAFRKDPSLSHNNRYMADLFDKAVKDPSILSDFDWKPM